MLNPEQQRAVHCPGGPLLVLAGAGSGKTRVLTQRIAHVMAAGNLWPRKILAVTFTNKAAGEMRERLYALIGQAASEMWIGTFHATCARLLRIYHDNVGLGRDFAIFDDDDQLRLVTQLLKAHHADNEVRPRAVLSSIDRAKSHGRLPTDRMSTNPPDMAARLIYPHYEEALARENAVDFSDLLLKVLALTKDPEVGPALAERFTHVLVDEFQDTNRVQYELVRHLSKATGNLTVVGDDDQSIYSWRGAEPRNLLDFDRDFPDATVVKLEQNYRSTSVILQAANGIIAHNSERHEKALWTAREGGEPIIWELCADDRAEADFVVRAISGLATEESRPLASFAILYRTHAQSRALEEMLRARDIAYRVLGGVAFFQRREIKDLRAYIRLILTPAADSAFERIVNTPARGLGKTTLDRLRGFAQKNGTSLMEAAQACVAGAVPAMGSAARKKLAAFLSLIAKLSELAKSGASVPEVIIQIVHRTGYVKRLEDEGTLEAQSRIDNISELLNMATEAADDTGGAITLAELEERMSLASATDNEAGGSVTLMTVHAAKGLEFPVVFVCGLEDGLFPSTSSREEAADRSMAEERRLAYVALTRAKDRVILTTARMRRQWGELKFQEPSRFIDEIPEACLAMRAISPMAQPRAARMTRARPERDELDQRTHHEDDVPTYSLDAAPVAADAGPSAGETVVHAEFGPGQVIDARGEGHGRKLLVQFPTVGVKLVLARYIEAQHRS
ncbi:MAG TPA: UvrD-helicase domain-containing protein [Kofleriaceae bacterium]|nr:UvrD-helicase domain-containing protein [Kofleriaceae bacterium]